MSFDVNTGTLSSNVTVIPGYLPLKLNITQSMTSGADLKQYVSSLRQAIGDHSTEYYCNDPHGSLLHAV